MQTKNLRGKKKQKSLETERYRDKTGCFCRRKKKKKKRERGKQNCAAMIHELDPFQWSINSHNKHQL